MEDEPRVILEEGVDSLIKNFTGWADTLRNQIEVLDSMKKSFSETDLGIFEMLNNINDTMEYSLLLYLVYLDLASSYRVYLNAKEKYDVLFSTKHLIVTINESFKNIYHYILTDGKGNDILKFRNNSFWVKNRLVATL